MELAEVVGTLAALRRFPIEPLSGETPNEAVVRPEGAVGDRVYELVDGRSGQPMTWRTAPDLLAYSVRYLEDLVVDDLAAWIRVKLPDGREFPLEAGEWLADVSKRRGHPVTLRPARSEEHTSELQ